MGSCVNKETRLSQIIDKEIEFDQIKGFRVIRILLLGSGQSGKSTILKQMRILHKNGFSHEELEAFKAVIQFNISTYMLTLLSAMKAFGIPFDDYSLHIGIQNCTLKYGSWKYGLSQIDLKTNNTTSNVAFFQENTEWELISMSNHRTVTNYAREPFVYIVYGLVIKRKPLYYVLTLVLPSFIITSIAIVGLFSPFNATGDKQEKVSMGLTTLLTMAVLLLVVSDQMPKTSTGLPLIAIKKADSITSINIECLLAYHNLGNADPPDENDKRICDQIEELNDCLDGSKTCGLSNEEMKTILSIISVL